MTLSADFCSWKSNRTFRVNEECDSTRSMSSWKGSMSTKIIIKIMFALALWLFPFNCKTIEICFFFFVTLIIIDFRNDVRERWFSFFNRNSCVEETKVNDNESKTRFGCGTLWLHLVYGFPFQAPSDIWSKLFRGNDYFDIKVLCVPCIHSEDFFFRFLFDFPIVYSMMVYVCVYVETHV